MARIVVEPHEQLARIFKRKRKEDHKNQLLPQDFVRRIEGERPDSGISLFRVDKMRLSEAINIVARTDYLHYGVAVSRAELLLTLGLDFTNREDNHPWHACMRCDYCDYAESPALCLATQAECPFLSLMLEQNERVRAVFKVEVPAMLRHELLRHV